jgi:hypothetical protein
MVQYTVTLALEDYLTVVFSALGLALLTRMVGQMERTAGRMALFGTSFIVAGGALKATGKLVLALGGPNLPILNLGLFPLIAPGFTLMTWALYQMRRNLQGQPLLRWPWLVPGGLSILFGTAALALGLAGGPWRVVLLVQSTLMNIATLVLLIVAAWGCKLWLTSALFLISMLVVLVMSQMASLPIQTLAMVWGEQISQTLAQMLFALGAWQYGAYITTTYRPRLVTQSA